MDAVGTFSLAKIRRTVSQGARAAFTNRSSRVASSACFDPLTPAITAHASNDSGYAHRAHASAATPVFNADHSLAFALAFAAFPVASHRSLANVKSSAFPTSASSTFARAPRTPIDVERPRDINLSSVGVVGVGMIG
jgi:hypothetical protein